jgi:hypothetical protein
MIQLTITYNVEADTQAEADWIDGQIAEAQESLPESLALDVQEDGLNRVLTIVGQVAMPDG